MIAVGVSVGGIIRAGFALGGSGACQICPLWVSFEKLNGWCSVMV